MLSAISPRLGFSRKLFVASIVSAAASFALPNELAASGARRGPYCLPTSTDAPFDFELPLLDGNGKTFRLARLDGYPVWLVFFASWCAPCNDEARDISALAHQYRDAGLRVVGIAVNDSLDGARSFRDKHKIDFPIAVDQKSQVFHDLGASGLPTHIFLDRRGYLTCAATRMLEPRQMDNEISVAIEHVETPRRQSVAPAAAPAPTPSPE